MGLSRRRAVTAQRAPQGTQNYYYVCTKCGYQLFEDYKCCPNCGEKVSFNQDKGKYCTECGRNIYGITKEQKQKIDEFVDLVDTLDRDHSLTGIR